VSAPRATARRWPAGLVASAATLPNAHGLGAGRALGERFAADSRATNIETNGTAAGSARCRRAYGGLKPAIV